LIQRCFPRRSDLFGCPRSKPSQGGVPADLAERAFLGFVFNCKAGPSWVLRRPVETTAVTGQMPPRHPKPKSAKNYCRDSPAGKGEGCSLGTPTRPGRCVTVQRESCTPKLAGLSEAAFRGSNLDSDMVNIFLRLVRILLDMYLCVCECVRNGEL
jgi:hypothetical protein